MHQDAVTNYETNTIKPLDLQLWTDKDVVLILWGNTRYQSMTGDTQLNNIPQGLRERWYGADSVAQAKNDSDWSKLRTEFEEHGWQ